LDSEADPGFPIDPTHALHELALCLGRAADPVASSLAPAAAALLLRYLRFDEADPAWPDQDRLLLGGAAASLAGQLAALLGAPPLVLPMPEQSLGTAMGTALAERMLAARFGRSLVDHRIWLLADSTELSAGAAQEAAMLAGALQLGRLTVIAAIQDAHWPGLARFSASGWSVRRLDSNDPHAACSAISAATRSRKPTLIACRATLAPFHGMSPLTRRSDWGGIGHRAAAARRAWLKREKRHTSREAFERAVAGLLPLHWQASLPPPDLTGADLCTEQAVNAALARLTQLMHGLISVAPDQGVPTAGYTQTACGALVGMALHGGILPVGRTSLADSEKLRPALRLAALLSLRVLHVLTEPPSPCPTGGLRTALRAMNNVFVFRPAGAAEALACLELALRRNAGPSVLLLAGPRAPAQAPAAAPLTHAGEGFYARLCARGGYVRLEPARPRDLTLIACGAELMLALEAAAQLGTEGVAAAVVSLPCWDLFALQDKAYCAAVLGNAPRLGIEAGSGFGWERFLGEHGVFLGPEAGIISLPRIMQAARALAGAMETAP
jgi:transketolase